VLVWVASYPRSGNTLTLLVLRNAYRIGRLGADFEEDLSLGRLPARALPGTETSSWRPPPELEGLAGDQLLDALRVLPEPYFVKTHRVSRATDPAPALYLVRDGRDALVSHAHFVSDNDAPRFRGLDFESRLAALIHPGIRAHGGWSRSVRAWRERDGQTATIRFEDLIRDPVSVVGAASAEIGVTLPQPSGRAPSFDRLRELSPLIFRRGEVGAWRDEMPAHLEERFWRYHGMEMKASGYAEPLDVAGRAT
jgi:hypothetical protein